MLAAVFSLAGGKALIEAGGRILAALIEFFKTPVGQFVAIALLIGAAYVGGKVVEHHKLTAEHKAAIAALNTAWQTRETDAAASYERARQNRDASIAADVRAGVDRQLADRQALIASLQEKLDANDKNSPTPAAACRISDDLVRRRGGLLERTRK